MKLRNSIPRGRVLAPALAAAALMSGAGSAIAAPVSTNLQFSCPFPLIGEQPISAEITADIPTNAVVGTPLPAFAVTAMTLVNEDSRTGLKLVGSETVEGTAVNTNQIITAGRTVEQTVTLTIPPSPIPSASGPFTVPANGQAPEFTFTDQDVGNAEIRVGGLTLNLVARTASGDIAPAPIGEITTNCTLLAGQDNLLQTVTVENDTVETPRLAVNRTDVAFGNVQAGLTKDETVTLSNTGNAALGINSISIAGTNASAFMQSNSCNTIAAGASCNVNVTYIPDGEGPQSATLTINSTDADNSSVDVALTGRSVLAPVPEIAVTPGSVDLGRIQLGQSKSAQVTISNNGTDTLLINSINVAGQDASEFLQTNNCTTVAPAQTCAIDVGFTAASAGVRNAQLVISSSDPENAEVSVALTAEGYEAPTNELELLLSLAGSTYIKSSDSSLPLTGSIATLLELASGTFEADLNVDPTVGHFSIKLLFSRLKATANVEFQQSEMTTGSLVNGKLTANSHLFIKVPKVQLKLFGLPIKVGGGDQCQSIQPVDITLTSKDGSNFSPATGGEVSGVYDLPPLENCGLLTSVLNQFLTGSGNTIDLTLTPEL
ncbi:choice-of-anchor D domain-containing protein [Marinobacter sp. 1-3A]|uniref:choice-of-anchor D domain-containing protein n=1 Tax=unclassified Marinobacter TaxID=83889 RepID=UPI00190332C4|nr:MULTISPECIES: choice-of-anchor D domain-containing protein [unclassified Marinobacter]MBK1872750.1 choice-of-anchor D domain-containing protein [Marinobacter sp. 1-3A]MBK1886824.1 choice-of-anchor D domain-containing protein [Marinobacter sp. DY40_1A1]